MGCPRPGEDAGRWSALERQLEEAWPKVVATAGVLAFGVELHVVPSGTYGGPTVRHVYVVLAASADDARRIACEHARWCGAAVAHVLSSHPPLLSREAFRAAIEASAEGMARDLPEPGADLGGESGP